MERLEKQMDRHIIRGRRDAGEIMVDVKIYQVLPVTWSWYIFW